jgi:hypothetical protein
MALPVVDTNQPGVKELIQGSVKEIANTIFATASVSITAAAKAVTPSIPQMVADITEDLRAGPVNRFSQGLEKLDKLLQNFGGEIKDYSKELAKFVTQREARIDKSEKTIRELRENNVKAEIDSMGNIQILSKFQIDQKEKELKIAEEAIAKEKANIEVKTKLVQEEKGNTKARRESILESQNTIIEKEKERTKLLEVLNKKEEDTSDEARMTIKERASKIIEDYVPDGLRDIGNTFIEGLLAPINAVKDLGRIFGGLLKPLKLLPKLLKGFTVGLLGALAAMVPYLLIAAAVVVAIIALKKGFDFLKENIDTVKDKLSNFADAVMEIPNTIKTFFTDIFSKIKNFFIDMINSVITLLNDKLGFLGVDIEKLEKEPTVAEQKQQEALSTMKSDEAYSIPDTQILTAPESKIVSESKLPFNVNKKPEMLTPPVDASNTNNATIVDNSVKSNIQNNTTNSGGLNGVRDNELEVFNRMLSNASA